MVSSKAPVLLLVFNRLDTLKPVFEKIKEYQPPQLFIASDGPRIYKDGEANIVTGIREYVLNEINWPCEVKTLFREENLGCGVGVSSAITWFFEQVESGIILEDDCLASPGFFEFCEAMLDYYAADESVYEISGTCLQQGIKRGDGSYYFSNYVGIWGWASWARAWNHYDFNINDYEAFKKNKGIELIFDDIKQQVYWLNIFDNAKADGLDTWDYQWAFSIWSNRGKCIIPNKNLITNLGFNTDGTHTLGQPFWYKKLTSGSNSIIPLVHPTNKNVDKEADDFLFYKTTKAPFFRKLQAYVKRLLQL